MKRALALSVLGLASINCQSDVVAADYVHRGHVQTYEEECAEEDYIKKHGERRGRGYGRSPAGRQYSGRKYRIEGSTDHGYDGKVEDWTYDGIDGRRGHRGGEGRREIDDLELRGERRQSREDRRERGDWDDVARGERRQSR